MKISQLIVGLIMVIGGFILVLISFLPKENSVKFLLIYAIPLIIIGLFILLNKKEDQIEQINYRGKK